MKKAAILYSEYTPVIDAIKHKLSDFKVDCFTKAKDAEHYDLIILVNYKDSFSGNALACHHSLLPAFNTEEPAKKAMLEGVKVTGITIYYTKPFKIIAQYPIFINNDMHFDELEQELNYLEQNLLPAIAEKLMRNETFETATLFNKKTCGTSCGGCSSCNH